MAAEEEKLRLMLVEDNFLTRFGTKAFLAQLPGVEVVGEAENGAEALTLYPKIRPDVVLCDLRMPQVDGVQFIASLIKDQPSARVLVLSHYHGDDDISRALKAGALGYLTKETGGDELILAIRAVASGKRYFPNELAAQLADSVVQPALTNRELQILEKIFEGLSNREIAESLSLTERTTAIYVSNVLQKLSAKSRTDAIRIALKRGILQVK